MPLLETDDDDIDEARLLKELSERFNALDDMGCLPVTFLLLIYASIGCRHYTRAVTLGATCMSLLAARQCALTIHVCPTSRDSQVAT